MKQLTELELKGEGFRFCLMYTVACLKVHLDDIFSVNYNACLLSLCCLDNAHILSCVCFFLRFSFSCISAFVFLLVCGRICKNSFSDDCCTTRRVVQCFFLLFLNGLWFKVLPASLNNAATVQWFSEQTKRNNTKLLSL